MPYIFEDIEEIQPVVINSRLYQLRKFTDHIVLIRRSDKRNVLFVGQDCVLWDIQLDLARHRCRENPQQCEEEFNKICERLEFFGIKDDPWHLLPKGWKSMGGFIHKPGVHAATYLLSNRRPRVN